MAYKNLDLEVDNFWRIRLSILTAGSLILFSRHLPLAQIYIASRLDSPLEI